MNLDDELRDELEDIDVANDLGCNQTCVNNAMRGRRTRTAE